MATRQESITEVIKSQAQTGALDVGGLAGLLKRKLESLQAGRPVYEKGVACAACLDTTWEAQGDGNGVKPCPYCRKPKETDQSVSRITANRKAFNR